MGGEGGFSLSFKTTEQSLGWRWGGVCMPGFAHARFALSIFENQHRCVLISDGPKPTM